MAIKSSLVTSAGLTITDTISAGQEVAITTLFFCNYSASDVVLSGVHLVRSGDTATNTNKIIHNLSIPAGETFTFDTEKVILQTGDSIYSVASADSRLSVTVSSLRVA
jgi:hypothetical protein